MRVKHRKSLSEQVRVVQRKQYNCLFKIFCCKCISCCQSIDFSLLTSEHRKDLFFKMIKKYVASIEKEQNVVIDPFFILVGLLLGEKNQEINNFTMLEMGGDLQRHAIFSKEDLELYISQLCTYLVFHQEMRNIPIFDLLEHTARTDIQFALLYYSNMRSLEVINHNTEFKVVKKYNQTFLNKIDQVFLPSPLAQKEDSTDTKLKQLNNLQVYRGISCPKDQQVGVFRSSINFWDDLSRLGQDLVRLPDKDRRQQFELVLEQINKQLPAKVYLPFRGGKYRHMVVLNMVISECRLFSTKERVPFYVCAELAHSKAETRDRVKVKRVRSMKQLQSSNLRRSQLFQQDNCRISTDESLDQGDLDKNGWLGSINRLVGRAKQLYGQQMSESSMSEYRTDFQDMASDLFGPGQTEVFEKIRQSSPYSQLNGYQVAHFMVKTKDDLRQQSFAMQLLEEFNIIFKMEDLPLRVFPYEVIPLGENFGLIEFLQGTITIDEMRKKGSDFSFIQQEGKVRNFITSLAGYCLVTYILQVKDRHNGNIMLKRDGSIIHIDFGFFMSNSPGKGVELQKNMAFKMPAEYIEVMGGLKSKNFQQFRKLFYQGFQACRKHQHRILILTKLMYSSHGTTMPCFEKGSQAIESLEDRLNPPSIRTDGDISLFCQNLVNRTIDHWRGRWYDKWQYYMQGILY